MCNVFYFSLTFTGYEGENRGERREKKNGGKRGREIKKKKCHLFALCLIILIWLMERIGKEREKKRKKKRSL